MRTRSARVAVAMTVAGTVAMSAALAGVGGSVAGAGADRAAGAGRNAPFRILLITSLSTPYTKTNGQTVEVMTKAAATVVNRSGGVNGHKVVVTVADTRGKPTTAVTELESALNSSKRPDLVLNGNAGTEGAALMPVEKQAKVLDFNESPSKTSGVATDFPTSFDMSPSTAAYVRSFVAYTKAHHWSKVGVFYGNDNYGQSIGATMTSAAKAAGLTVTGSTSYKVTGLTYAATLESLQATHPQVLWADAYGAASGYTLTGLQKVGWTIPVLGDDSFSVSPPVTTAPPTGQLGTAAEKDLQFQTVAAGVWKPKAQTPKNTETMLQAMHRVGTPKSSLLFGYEYDAVLMASYAARAAHTLSTATKLAKEIVRQQKKHVVPTGLFTSYGYTASSHYSTVPPSSFAFVKPSRLVTGQFGSPGSTH